MKLLENYMVKLQSVISSIPKREVLYLAETLRTAWSGQKQVFICGNGGSAANALHIANDLFFGIAKGDELPGLRVQALPANQSITTCLANDISYADVFSEQLKVYANRGDVLIALSGSGNSANIIKAIKTAKDMGLQTFAILGYSGGKCLDMVDTAIHCAVDDMQIAEDVQVIVGHSIMQWLRVNPPERVTLNE